MRAPDPTGLRRWFAFLILLAFGASSQGLSGVELAAHLTGVSAHERVPHVERGGQPGHADHCQLGLITADGRLPAPPPPRLARAGSHLSLNTHAYRSVSAAACLTLVLPRAPPV